MRFQDFDQKTRDRVRGTVEAHAVNQELAAARWREKARDERRDDHREIYENAAEAEAIMGRAFRALLDLAVGP